MDILRRAKYVLLAMINNYLLVNIAHQHVKHVKHIINFNLIQIKVFVYLVQVQDN